MSELSGLSGPQKLTSQLKVSLEGIQKQANATPTMEIKEIQQFEMQLEQINHAFALVKEIRTSLEAALRDLSN